MAKDGVGTHLSDIFLILGLEPITIACVLIRGGLAVEWGPGRLTARGPATTRAKSLEGTPLGNFLWAHLLNWPQTIYISYIHIKLFLHKIPSA